jgi:cytidine deaminase
MHLSIRLLLRTAALATICLVGATLGARIQDRPSCPTGKCPHHPAHCHFCEPDLSQSMNPMDDDRTLHLLIHRALSALERARHSNWELRRGCALLSVEGLILCGASMETAYSGDTLTAESTVVGRAVTEGIFEAHGLVIAGYCPNYPSRRDLQLLAEFNSRMPIVFVDPNGRILYEVCLKDLERLEDNWKSEF